MITSFLCKARTAVWLLVLSCLLTTACHSHRIPSPTGPPQPKKVKASKTADATETADGSTATAPPPQHNSYDKNGLLKKPKLERRRVKHKVGQLKFLGIVLPF